MSTLVCFHAHPDDEAITTGGLMAKAAAAGHRVVLVCATRGEQGEPQAGVLLEGEQLSERRIQELANACEALGAEPPLLLGYEDSGMMDEPTNQNPNCFWQADIDEASERLAAILDQYNADVLTIYDDHGGYGHPDHIQVHRVGKKAAALAGVAHVFEATINRDAMRTMMENMPIDDDAPRPDDVDSFGTPADDLSYEVNVSGYLEAKRAALIAHRSQIGPDSFFLKMPDDLFALAFGTESFAVPGVTGTGGPREVHLLPGL
ncbi:MAG: GlcNAc-PI de-N-acetylase [Acidimicrobiales bacterium]|nr:GlcNAc-PI de-N-acetylase [Acidimicrobiales bacterium]